MAPERTRVLVRSLGGRRRHPARAPGTGPPALGDLVAGHDVGRPGWATRQPHPEPGGGAIRRRRLPDARPAPAGPPAGAGRTRRPGQRVGLALAGAQPRAGAAAPGHQARRRPARPTVPRPDQAHEGLAGAAGRGQAAPFGHEAAPAAAGGGRLRTPTPTPTATATAWLLAG